MNNCIVITGQTATGKTSLALRLAQTHNGELINVDSRQVYKKLDIITGKDITADSQFTLVEKMGDFEIGYYMLHGTKIWLYDIVHPKQLFSAIDYAVCALRVIEILEKQGKTPIIVGGTYYYLKNLLYGHIETISEPDEKLRAELNIKDISEIQEILKTKKPKLFESLNNSEKHNRHRLIRKIELLNQPQVNSSTNNIGLSETHDVQMIGLHYEKNTDLETAITKRVHDRIEQGAIAEVENLLKAGYTSTDPGLRTIGYIQIMQYLTKELTLEEMIQIWITKEIQYAKRQKTFIQADTTIQWYSPLDTDHII
ncbi:MAG: tRNA (adenosine(37)-N6)-dimethylallyltransferase [Weeksellaceae bacterium]